MGFAMSVSDDLHVGDRDESLAHHLLERRKETLDLRRLVDDTENTTSPSSTICSSTGRYARILASASTTEIMIGRSLDRLMRFSFWNRRCSPRRSGSRQGCVKNLSSDFVRSRRFLSRHSAFVLREFPELLSYLAGRHEPDQREGATLAR